MLRVRVEIETRGWRPPVVDMAWPWWETNWA